ncbi:MAG: hypothetical protein NW217_03150 [Hyphomicrobiaceae bacterium]|nr:hypothetical protein [Hyphomicrobiaceae bacterium]
MRKMLRLADWCRGAGAVLLGGLPMLLAGAGSSHAAVRVCTAHVTSDVAVSASEVTARREAIMSWVRKSKSVTIPHPAWRIANLKVLKCVPAQSEAGFECVAHAAPCTIRQIAPGPR